MGTSRNSPHRLLWVGGLILAALLTPSPGPAQDLKTTSLLVTIPRLSELSISGDVSGLLSLSVDSGESAYDAGFVESAADAVTLTLNTNDAWDLSARLAGDWTCPGTYDKDETDLLVRITNTPTGTIQSGASDYITLGTSDTMILTHASSVTGNEVDIQTKVLLDWGNDVPGAYEITLTYTLVTHVP